MRRSKFIIKSNQIMDSTDSSSGSQHPHLPPGFRFHPTDEELVVHYLKRKAASAPLPVSIIAEIDLYKFDPWELPSKATFGEQEWYFFSPRDRKYPNGARPNRAATSGYWKATGTDKPILTSNGHHKVGVKKALVFYGGKPPKGVKTNWIMHEYRLIENNNNNNNSSFNSSSKPPLLPADPPNNNKKNSLRLDDWVLCRIYKKSNSTSCLTLMEHEKVFSMETTMMTNNKSPSSRSTTSYGGVENDDNIFDGILGADHQNGSEHLHDDLIISQNQNSKGDEHNMKRALTFWNETAGSPGSSSSNKRFHGDLNSGNSTAEENNSFVALLSQLPQSQSAAFHSNAIIGQPFQLPGINWN